ncbi:MAG: response regulator, partial [Candidatus Cryosericum sp.]
GGWIVASSRNGPAGDHGATFDIYLPRCLEAPTPPRTTGQALGSVCRGTVLVVEDEPVVAGVARAFLEKSGCSVLSAGDGSAAMAILQEEHANIGLVLLDMTMPGMTTSEIVHAIRSLDPALPILLSSGNTSSGIVEDLLEAGAVQGFLEKPYTLAQLTDRVMSLIRSM